MDTQLRTNHANQPAIFGTIERFTGLEKLNDEEVEEGEGVQCECRNSDDRENLVCSSFSLFARSNK